MLEYTLMGLCLPVLLITQLRQKNIVKQLVFVTAFGGQTTEPGDAAHDVNCAFFRAFLSRVFHFNS